MQSTQNPVSKGTPPVCYNQLLLWERDIFLICTLTNVVIFQAVLITDMPHCLLTVKQRSLWRKVAYRKYGLVCSILVAGAPLSTFIRKLCILYKGRQKSETASLPEQQPTHQTRKFIARSRFGRILSKEGILMVVMSDFCKEFHFTFSRCKTCLPFLAFCGWVCDSQYCPFKLLQNIF